MDSRVERVEGERIGFLATKGWRSRRSGMVGRGDCADRVEGESGCGWFGFSIMPEVTYFKRESYIMNILYI